MRGPEPCRPSSSRPASTSTVHAARSGRARGGPARASASRTTTSSSCRSAGWCPARGWTRSSGRPPACDHGSRRCGSSIAGRGRDRERLGRLVAAHRRPGRVPRLRRRGGQGRAARQRPTCSPCCAATAGAASSRRATASCSPRRPPAGSPSCADARAGRTRPWTTEQTGLVVERPASVDRRRLRAGPAARAMRPCGPASAPRPGAAPCEALTYDSLGAARLAGTALAVGGRNVPPLRP